MMIRPAKLALVFLAAIFLASCAAYQPDAAFKPEDLSGQGLVRRADNFLIIMDVSQSMATVPTFNGKSDLRREWDIVTRINQSLPDSGFIATLRTVGGVPCPFAKVSKVEYGPALWDRDLFQQALEDVNHADGAAPIAKGLSEATADLSYTSGSIALILLSGGTNLVGSDPVAATKALKATYGDRICVSAILIGNDIAGKKVLAQVVEAGGCGILADEKVFDTPEGVAGFVKRVFFQAEPRKPTLATQEVPAPAPAVVAPGVQEQALPEPVTGKKPSLKKPSLRKPSLKKK